MFCVPRLNTKDLSFLETKTTSLFIYSSKHDTFTSR